MIILSYYHTLTIRPSVKVVRQGYLEMGI